MVEGCVGGESALSKACHDDDHREGANRVFCGIAVRDAGVEDLGVKRIQALLCSAMMMPYPFSTTFA